MFPPIFLADTKIIYGYNFVALLIRKHCDLSVLQIKVLRIAHFKTLTAINNLKFI